MKSSAVFVGPMSVTYAYVRSADLLGRIADSLCVVPWVLCRRLSTFCRKLKKTDDDLHEREENKKMTFSR